jgi:phospholipid/cholesterol/gamma-HCH transport system substrate-binding protein
MRRIVLICTGLLAAAMLIALPAIGSNGSSGDYKVRAIFDNGSFVVSGEEVRVAGAKVGTVESVDVSTDDEIVSQEGGDHAIPGKAVVVMSIDDPGFKDFRIDASCLIRPQSLIGEKFLDCTQTQARAAGQQPPPELSTIPDGQPGEGQRLLPLENNGKTVDLDLIQNIQRLPYRDRFRIILNDLGAGLAGRGEDLGAVIDRANPALRQTDRVLNILALQSRQLASLASNGDTVLEPLARNRTHVTGFLRNAAIAGQATAERSADLELGLQRFPATLHQLRLTMAKLKDFTDQGTPLFTDLNRSAKGLNKATVKLPAFATAAIPALQTLGTAAQSAGPKLVQADPLLSDLAATASASVPVGQNFSALADTFTKTGGFQYLMDFIYNSVGITNGFDAYGHFLRSNLQISNCVEVSALVIPGCEAFFQDTGTTQTQKKKKKKKRSRKAKKLRAAGVAPPPPAQTSPQASPIPPVEIPPIDQLLPELTPTPPSPEEPPAETDQPGQPQQQGEEGTTPSDQNAAYTQTLAARLNPAYSRGMSMRDASLFLQFLLGGEA